MRGVMVLLLSHGLHRLLVKIYVEELVVEEHARDVGYSGVIHPVRRVVHRLYPAVQEHQRKLRQVRIDTKDRLANSAAECLDLVAFEDVAGKAPPKFFKALSPDVGDVVEAVALL